jgi:hypothetical protein
MFLAVSILVLLCVFSCSKKTVKISENEEEYVIIPEKEEEIVSTFSLDHNINIVNNDDEIWKKILGNWIIFEKNGQPIRQYDVPRFDDEYTLGFKTDYFWRYSSNMEGGYELAWNVEDEKIHIINNNQNDRLKSWIDSHDEMIGTYDVTFVDEKILFLKHDNGNIYKCYSYSYPNHLGEFIEGIKLLDIFLENKSNIDIRYTYNKTLLMYFIQYDKPDLAIYLIDKGINIHETNMYGQTALHYAVSWLRPDVIEELLKSGSDINKIDDLGQTPLDIAELDYKEGATNGERVRQLLRSNGAINNKSKNGT